MARRSRTKGGKTFRRLMKNIPASAREEFADVLELSGRDLAGVMRARVRRRTGALGRGVKWKVLRKSLKLRVGVLGSPRARGKLFYGYILNWGRKAQTAKANRRTQSGAVSSYLMRVSARAGDRSITGAGSYLLPVLNKRLASVWERILGAAARGAGNE
ncbi:hypothetical protein [Sphingobium boeckii]|uniref:HK97 gp10 family phage protein n=1 Tax=Sphingobium boeckii TaxID=1082345 RepID=A0A7W9AF38_9SPHN|nr:hypothetical protein [Sphingobium boeckii]MBB5684294.1 hypothetical protein [Sphingobium boeckii]